MTCLVANSCVLEGVQLTVHFGNMNNQAPILSAQVGGCGLGAGAGHRDCVWVSQRCKAMRIGTTRSGPSLQRRAG